MVVGERFEKGRERSKQKGWSKSRRKSKSKKDARCYKCHEIGHFKRDCPQLRNKHEETSEFDSVSAVADVEVVDDLLVVSDDHRLYLDIWTLDSACSHHYTPNRSWFSTYTKTEKDSVTLGDDHPCKVAGIENI